MANDWQYRHEMAICSPLDCEGPHVQLYQAVSYMRERLWTEDGFACGYVAELCRAARGLLNMETGRLDCATLDRFYCDVLRECGEEP